jgi:hypothetical protein
VGNGSRGIDEELPGHRHGSVVVDAPSAIKPERFEFEGAYVGCTVRNMAPIGSRSICLAP